MTKYLIKTERLGLRNWKESDMEEACRMNADERVMEFFRRLWRLDETSDFIKRMQSEFEQRGYCYFAVELLETGEFIGFTGLLFQKYKSEFTPCVDIGWRLLPAFWAMGYATEAAKACLSYGFKQLDLKEIFAVCPRKNLRSQNIMQKLGMVEHCHFVHPKLDSQSDLKNCIAFVIEKENFE